MRQLMPEGQGLVDRLVLNESGCGQRKAFDDQALPDPIGETVSADPSQWLTAAHRGCLWEL